MQYTVTIQDYAGRRLKEYVYAPTSEAAVRAVVGTPTLLGRYKFSCYSVVEVHKVR